MKMLSQKKEYGLKIKRRKKYSLANKIKNGVCVTLFFMLQIFLIIILILAPKRKCRKLRQQFSPSSTIISNKYVNIYKRFGKYYNSLNVQVYSVPKNSFHVQLLKFAQENNETAFHSILQIKMLFPILNSKNITYGDNTNKTEKSFYETLYIYFKMLRIAIELFEKDPSIEIEMNDNYPKNFLNDNKFIYQQLHIYTITDMGTLLVNYYYRILYKITEHMDTSDSYIELAKHIEKSFIQLKANMFAEFKWKTSFKYDGEYYTTNTLLRNFNHYKRFIITSICMIYFTIFKIDTDKRVTGIKSDALNVFLNYGRQMTNKNNIEKLIKINCKDVFKNIELIGTIGENDFYTDFNKINHNCYESLLFNLNK